MKESIKDVPWFVNPQIVEVRQWNYLPLMKSEALAQGGYSKLWNINGQDKLYLSGDCVSFESVDNIYDYNYHLTTQILYNLEKIGIFTYMYRSFWNIFWHRW